MAAIVAPIHRHHALWLRVVEDLAFVVCVALVGWVLFTTIGLHQTTLRSVILPPGLLGPSAPPASKPLSVVAASQPTMAAVKAALALEAQGSFGTETMAAWRRARDEFRRFAVQPVATRRKPMMLWLLEVERERADQLAADIVAAGAHPETVEALDALRAEALENVALIGLNREIVNFDYWRALCEAFEPGVEARESAWRASKATDAGRLGDAKEAHEASFRAWRRLLDVQPGMVSDPLMAEELNAQIDLYRDVLAGMGEAFPATFVLQDVVDHRVAFAN